MEDCCTVAVSFELCSWFPTLLQLSTEEVVAIWDAVSAYILGQLKLDKGVVVTGLGTFAVVQERFVGEEEVYVVRRPVFQLDMDAICLQELAFPTVLIPGNIEIKTLNYEWLSQATSFPQHMVEDCVQETIFLYSFQLRNRQRLAFAFKDIGVLSCRDNVLCMRFYYDCVTGLESEASQIALLHTRLWMPGAALSRGATTAQGMEAAPAHAFPRFRFIVIGGAVAKDFASRHKKAGEKHRPRRSTGTGPCCPGLTTAQLKCPPRGAAPKSFLPPAEACPGKLLQRRAKLPLPVLPTQGPSTRQQDTGKKPSASVLPPCPGSSARTKETVRQGPVSPARPTAAPPSSEGCRRALQEVWQVSAEREKVPYWWKERRDQAKAELEAWEAWSAGEDQQPPQALGAWTPHPPAQPRRKEVNKRWRQAENPLPEQRTAAAAQLRWHQTAQLSPRAVQVLRRLETYHQQRNIFKHVAENNRRHQEQQRQLP
ncbi:coiled-coil domain-containing protein 81-like isoform X2 [Athene cunicularia]|uniref:coiled-coil domain-containing protein 81-like isoform X2 n=1 Tax=Athene cunicularia TaxID=194338 RepID=UPI000EF72C5D|nr:coiled-coil domain-containing protein 81-like isoform X2 [Athene cunicularia]